jgi:SAM-dependent methyltransferase
VGPDTVVLEAGAGPAVLGEVLRARAATYVALDLSLDNLVAARERIGEFAGVVGDLTALPIADNAFDGTAAIGCLEYVPDLEAAVGELCRVTAPGGFILASFANRDSPRRWWDEAVIHRLSRLRRRRRGEGGSVYRRRLTSRSEASELLGRGGANVERVELLNPGLIGYPLSRSAHIRRMEEGLARRSGAARARASELIVLARKRSG